MPRVDVAGLQIAYERAGSGEPVVLVHGYVGDGRSTWGPQLEALSDTFTVVAWDGPGAGGSSDPPEWFRLPDFADCLAMFVQQLELTRPHVVGMSFGGGLALELHRRHPTVPATLTLAASYAGWAGSLPPAEVERRLSQALALAEAGPDAVVSALAPTLFSPAAPTDVIGPFVESLRAFRPVGLRVMARAIAEADLRQVLPTVSVPTLLLYGDQDVRAPVSVGQAMHAAIHGSRLVVLPGVGHLSCLEAADRFTDELRRFLADRAPPRPA